MEGYDVGNGLGKEWLDTVCLLRSRFVLRVCEARQLISKSLLREEAKRAEALECP